MKEASPCWVPGVTVGVVEMVISIMSASTASGTDTDCTLNLSLLTRGHREGMPHFLLPEMGCPKKILEEHRLGLGHVLQILLAAVPWQSNWESLKIPVVVVGRVLPLRSPPGWCFLPILPSTLNSKLKQWAYLPKINSKSLEDSFTKLGSRSVLGCFQSLKFFFFPSWMHIWRYLCASIKWTICDYIFTFGLELSPPLLHLFSSTLPIRDSYLITFC